MRVGLYLSTLYGLYGFSGCVGTPGHDIHELVDDVAVKPCQWSRDAAEDDLLGHEQPDFVHVETLVGRTVQGAEACSEHVGYRLLFAGLHPGSQGNGDDGNSDTRTGYCPVEVDVVGFTVG